MLEAHQGDRILALISNEVLQYLCNHGHQQNNLYELSSSSVN